MDKSAIVKGISLRGDSTYLVSVAVSNGEESETVEFVLLDELFESLNIEVGDEVGEELTTLDRYSGVTAAYFSACLSLAFVQSSLKALYRIALFSPKLILMSGIILPTLPDSSFFI